MIDAPLWLVLTTLGVAVGLVPVLMLVQHLPEGWRWWWNWSHTGTRLRARITTARVRRERRTARRAKHRQSARRTQQHRCGPPAH